MYIDIADRSNGRMQLILTIDRDTVLMAITNEKVMLVASMLADLNRLCRKLPMGV